MRRTTRGGRTPLTTVELLLEAINEGEGDRTVSLDEPEAAYIVEPGKMAIGIEAMARRAPLAAIGFALKAFGIRPVKSPP